MGLFDVRCAISGIAVTGPAYVVFLRLDAGTAGAARWRPCALPVRGRYDGYGLCEVADDPALVDATLLALVASATSVARPNQPSLDDLDALVATVADAMFDPPARLLLDGAPLTYALIDEELYAVAATLGAPDPYPLAIDTGASLDGETEGELRALFDTVCILDGGETGLERGTLLLVDDFVAHNERLLEHDRRAATASAVFVGIDERRALAEGPLRAVSRDRPRGARGAR